MKSRQQQPSGKSQRRRKQHRSDPPPVTPMNDAAALSWRMRVSTLLLPATTEPRTNWKYLWPLLLAALGVRIAVALAGDFVLHPDEIMQYLEPAHQQVFGNGILHWEYIYGARHWLTPGFVTAILWLLNSVSLAEPAIYINTVKIGFCLLSMLIPWGMYRFAQNVMGERTARLALLCGCFWYELIGFAHKPMQEFVATAVFMLGLALVSDNRHKRSLSAAFAVGFVFAAVGALRMQYAPFALLLLLLAALSQKPRALLTMLGGAITLVSLVMGMEWLTWGGGLHSYLLNMLVNLELNELRRGESPAIELLLRLTVASFGGVLIACLAVVMNPRRTALLALMIAALVLIHMQLSHREYRFIYLCLPLWMLLAANAVVYLESRLSQNHVAIANKTVVSIALAINVLALFNQFPQQQWIHKGYSRDSGYVNYLIGQNPIFEAFRYLAKQNDVTAVFVHPIPYFNTPGYYYLHHDIPFYDYNQLRRVITSSDNKASLGEATLVKYLSHIVMNVNSVDLQLTLYESIARFGDWAVMRRKDNTTPVAALTHHIVYPDRSSSFHLIINKVKTMPVYKQLVKYRLINADIGNNLIIPVEDSNLGRIEKHQPG